MTLNSLTALCLVHRKLEQAIYHMRKHEVPHRPMCRRKERRQFFNAIPTSLLAVASEIRSTILERIKHARRVTVHSGSSVVVVIGFLFRGDKLVIGEKLDLVEDTLLSESRLFWGL